MRRWALAIAGLVFVAVGGLAVGSRVRTVDQQVADARPPSSTPVTATVEYRALDDVAVVRGSVRPESGAEVRALTEQELVVTRMPYRVPDSVPEGAAVIELSGRPVFVLAGTIPVFRDMKPGQQGPDVLQLQQALQRLGLKPGETTGTYGPGTAAAVERLYRNGGYEPAYTSDSARADLEAAARQVTTARAALASAQRQAHASAAGPAAELARADLELRQAHAALQTARAQSQSQIAAADERVEIAETEVDRVAADPDADPVSRTAADLALIDAKAAAESARIDGESQIQDAESAIEAAEITRAEARAALHQAEDPSAVTDAIGAVTAAEANLDQLRRSVGAVAPRQEVLFVPETPSQVALLTGTIGQALEPDTAALVLSGQSLVVDSVVQRPVAAVATVGLNAELYNEASGQRAQGVVTSIGDPTGTSEPDGTVLRVSPTEQLASDWLGADVRVTIIIDGTGAKSLVVPITAITTGPSGQQSVTVLTNDGTRRRVEIELTLTAGGFAAITANGRLAEGDLVEVRSA